MDTREQNGFWRLACSCAVEQLMPDASESQMREAIDRAAEAAHALYAEPPRALEPLDYAGQQKLAASRTEREKLAFQIFRSLIQVPLNIQIASKVMQSVRRESDTSNYMSVETMASRVSFIAADCFLEEREYQRKK